MAGAAMLRGSLSARPLALQASGLAFGHPCAALGRRQGVALPHRAAALPYRQAVFFLLASRQHCGFFVYCSIV
ncbi:hypothetical protein FRY97_18040 [Phaeodactylibacter luteus]|uniref:Uncharacterized protein n=1 Tax=Phaeodactylibacter luteus TaxID=1564516 RepID=A0A5C6RK16_9BACT|nr:hypothetical protein FRY97_18040 [Phaeodactylibacter luteus]